MKTSWPIVITFVLLGQSSSCHLPSSTAGPAYRIEFQGWLCLVSAPSLRLVSSTSLHPVAVIWTLFSCLHGSHFSDSTLLPSKRFLCLSFANMSLHPCFLSGMCFRGKHRITGGTGGHILTKLLGISQPSFPSSLFNTWHIWLSALSYHTILPLQGS